jgi:hypothetical protein
MSDIVPGAEAVAVVLAGGVNDDGAPAGTEEPDEGGLVLEIQPFDLTDEAGPDFPDKEPTSDEAEGEDA